MKAAIHIKRPTFLTIWLAFMTLAGIFELFSNIYDYHTSLPRYYSNFYSNVPAFAGPLYTLASLLYSQLYLFSIFLLWEWKKAGFYMIITLVTATTLMNGMIAGAAGIGLGFLRFTGIAILYLAIKPVWQIFK